MRSLVQAALAGAAAVLLLALVISGAQWLLVRIYRENYRENDRKGPG